MSHLKFSVGCKLLHGYDIFLIISIEALWTENDSTFYCRLPDSKFVVSKVHESLSTSFFHNLAFLPHESRLFRDSHQI